MGMKVAIIGAGFLGLSAAIELVDNKAEVVIFESEKTLGGLASGFRENGWSWYLEKYYHHVFANDAAIIKMAKKVNCPFFFTNPETDCLINGKILRLDTPLSVLKFSELSMWSRIRLGVGMLMFKIITHGLFLEQYKVERLLPYWVGKEAYEKIWKKLLTAKFGKYLPEVNMAWFWSRVYKRTASLGYCPGGFQNLADKMGEYIASHGGEINLNKNIDHVTQAGAKWNIDGQYFDKVLLTVPAPLAQKMFKGANFQVPKINYLWGQTLVLELKESLMKNYWLNILEDNWPFLVAVEHTNFLDEVNYGHDKIIYLGNYLEEGDERLKLTVNELILKYEPFLKKINHSFKKKWIKKARLFASPYAQPVFPVGYSHDIPKITTEVKNVYMANMSMVYPYDRGTNYAVKLGIEAAKILISFR